MTIQKAIIVDMLPAMIWVESDMMGARHVMVHHQGFREPFTYATFHYDYAYTSNSGTHTDAENLARALGASEPVEHRTRSPDMPTASELREHIAGMNAVLAGMVDA